MRLCESLAIRSPPLLSSLARGRIRHGGKRAKVYRRLPDDEDGTVAGNVELLKQGPFGGVSHEVRHLQIEPAERERTRQRTGQWAKGKKRWVAATCHARGRRPALGAEPAARRRRPR